jgi:ATP-binding cassette subfamily G (WHITE) protein 2 (SNQ2)
LLFNAFGAFSELPTQMLGRPVMFKQKNFTFYRPGALSVAGMLADLPVNLSMIFVFSVIVYFMAGLARSAAAFFSFFILVFVGFLAMAGFFRWTGTICSNFDIAARFATVVVISMSLYSGYIVPVYAMKRWLFWVRGS